MYVIPISLVTMVVWPPVTSLRMRRILVFTEKMSIVVPVLLWKNGECFQSLENNREWPKSRIDIMFTTEPSLYLAMSAYARRNFFSQLSLERRQGRREEFCSRNTPLPLAHHGALSLPMCRFSRFRREGFPPLLEFKQGKWEDLCLHSPPSSCACFFFILFFFLSHFRGIRILSISCEMEKSQFMAQIFLKRSKG
jgi:hypothetical protein